MRLVVAFIATLFFQTGKAQSFKANIDRSAIALDQYVQVEFTLENANGNNFTPPDFGGWTVIQGPSTSSSVSIINGVRSSSISYVFVLSPKSIGALFIGKASIVVGNKTLLTDPLKVSVSKSSPQASLNNKETKALSKQDIFVIAKANHEKAYVGQQIIIEYKLYTSVDVDNYNIIHTPEFKGFHVNNIPRLSYDNRESINGRNYVTKVIFAASIYPIQNGKFEIEPLHTRASVVVDDNRNNPGSFFLLPATEGVNLVSNPLQIDVQSLPQPVPQNFSGAVGNFSLATRVDQLNVKVNDAISVSLYVEGDGDLNRIGKPYLQLDSSAFQLYEPKITKENTDYKLNGFIGMRELIYPIVATQPGIYQIVPTFIYFNPDSEKYISLAPEIFNMNVTGIGRSAAHEDDNHIPLQDSELTIIKNPRLSGESRFIGSTTYYILLVLPLLGWLGSFFYSRKRFKKELENQDSIRLIRKKKDSLEKLNGLSASQNTSKTIADSAFDIMQAYLMEYLRIDDHAISKSEWKEKINNANLDQSIKSKIITVFNDAEMALFAGQMNQEEIKDMIKKVREIVENTNPEG